MKNKIERGYNLFVHVDKEVSSARELAIAIIPFPNNTHNPFWEQAAQNVLTAAILYYSDIGHNLADTLVAVHNMPVKKLITKIAKSNNTTAKLVVNQFTDLELPQSFMNIETVLHDKVVLFINQNVNNAILSKIEICNKLSQVSVENKESQP